MCCRAGAIGGRYDSPVENEMNRQFKAILTVSVLTALSTPLLADSDGAKIEKLEHQIEALQARIASLEARQTFATFMPDYAERFHVMHRAGESGDWAVASHELEEMKRITGISPSIDGEKGALMQGMMAPSFDALEDAIEHNSHEKFVKALTQTINTCNACHTATGSEFIQVTLDAQESLSMRHPHTFMERAVPGGHSHGAPASMGGMMEPAGAAKKPHDDTGKPAHND
jgi:hypothetical protein